MNCSNCKFNVDGLCQKTGREAIPDNYCESWEAAE